MTGAWIPIVNLAFKREEIGLYIAQMPFQKWHGQFCVLHNTFEPTLAQWHEPPPADPAHRMQNLAHLYRDIDHWHAGPHFYVADDLIWAFTPAAKPGVHSPSWNEVSWGIEMVGDYEAEPLGDAVAENTVEVIACLYHRFNIPATTLRLHKEDPLTTHKRCPGRNVIKADMINRIGIRLKQLAAEGLPT